MMPAYTMHQRFARGLPIDPCAVCGNRAVQIVDDSPRCAAHPFARPAWIARATDPTATRHPAGRAAYAPTR